MYTESIDAGGHAPGSCQHWQKEESGLHTGLWTTKGRMCDHWIESTQKTLGVSALRREDGHVKWSWCADIFGRRFVQMASIHSDSVQTPNLAGDSRSRVPPRTEHNTILIATRPSQRSSRLSHLDGSKRKGTVGHRGTFLHSMVSMARL